MGANGMSIALSQYCEKLESDNREETGDGANDNGAAGGHQGG